MLGRSGVVRVVLGLCPSRCKGGLCIDFDWDGIVYQCCCCSRLAIGGIVCEGDIGWCNLPFWCANDAHA